MIKCTKFVPFSSGTLQGFADFFIPKWGIFIHGCTLHSKDEKRWINFPSKEIINDEGEKIYLPYFHFEKKDHYRAFCMEAKKAVDAFCETV